MTWLFRKPLLVGQAPGPNTDPTRPLYPNPSHLSGGRLAEIMGLDPREYLRRFDRINLLYRHPGRWPGKNDDKWPEKLARVAAEAVRPLVRDRDVILVGRNVARAFGLAETPFHARLPDATVVIPHPAGRNHWYNDPVNRKEAHEFWTRYLRGSHLRREAP